MEFIRMTTTRSLGYSIQQDIASQLLGTYGIPNDELDA
jgi:hypothetical protein